MKAWLTRLQQGVRGVWKRFLKFGLVGASGTVVDLGVVVLLNWLFSGLATRFVARNLIQLTAYECSVVTNFLLSFYWVWRDRRGRFWVDFLKYNLSTALAFLVRLLVFNLGMVLLAGARAGEPLAYYTVYGFSIAVAMVFNFFIIHNKIFTRKETNDDKYHFTHV